MMLIMKRQQQATTGDSRARTKAASEISFPRKVAQCIQLLIEVSVAVCVCVFAIESGLLSHL